MYKNNHNRSERRSQTHELRSEVKNLKRDIDWISPEEYTSLVADFDLPETKEPLRLERVRAIVRGWVLSHYKELEGVFEEMVGESKETNISKDLAKTLSKLGVDNVRLKGIADSYISNFKITKDNEGNQALIRAYDIEEYTEPYLSLSLEDLLTIAFSAENVKQIKRTDIGKRHGELSGIDSRVYFKPVKGFIASNDKFLENLRYDGSSGDFTSAQTLESVIKKEFELISENFKEVIYQIYSRNSKPSNKDNELSKNGSSKPPHDFEISFESIRTIVDSESIEDLETASYKSGIHRKLEKYVDLSKGEEQNAFEILYQNSHEFAELIWNDTYETFSKHGLKFIRLKGTEKYSLYDNN